MADNWTPKTGKVIDSWTPKSGSIVFEQAITPKIVEPKPKRLPFGIGGVTEEQWRKFPYQSAIAQTVSEATTIPLSHFINQLLMNYPRQIAQKSGYEYPEAQTPFGKGLSQFAGIAGATVSPFYKAIGALTGAGKVVAPATRLAERVVRGALGGAVTAGAVAQPMEQRPKSAGLGAVLGGLFGAGAGVARKAITPKPLLTQEDKFLLQKSDDIYNVTQKAKGSIQEEYSIFRDATKDTPVNSLEINTNIKKLYGKTSKDVGQILPEDFTNEMKAQADEFFLTKKNPDLDIVYKVKDTISKHIKPTTWRKFKMGEQLTPDQEKLISSYFDFDKLIDNTLEKSGLIEEKQMLDYLNQKATDLYGVTGQIKKMVVDILGKPQKTSVIKSVFLGQGDAGKKALFQQLSEFEPSILEITQGLEKYKNIQNIKRLLTRAGIILGSGTLVGKGIQIGRELQRE